MIQLLPNSSGNRPCDKQGAPGNWVIWMSNGFAPKLYKWDTQTNQAVALAPGEEIKRGYYAEAYGTVQGNKATGNQSGIYLNLSMVCMRAYGDEIVSGPSVEQAGFGQGALPQGASTMPAANTTNVPPSAPPVQEPQVNTAPPPPAHDLAQGPGGNVAPPPPPVEVEMYDYQGKKQTRDEWKAAGWSDAQIDAHCTKA